MGNGTRSGLRNKDGESQSSRKKVDSREGISNASSRTATSSGSKQSAKGVFSGQTTSSPPSIRKSERLGKRTPPTTPVMRQSERLVNHGTPGPLRRSDRSKKNLSSSTSESNQSGKIVSSVDTGKRKEKKEKSMKQLTAESQRVLSSEKNERGSKRKRMDAHSYKSLFKSQKRRYLRSDSDDRSERQDRLSQIYSEESEGGDSRLVQDIEHEDHEYDHALSLPVGLRVVKEHPGEPVQAGLEAASPKPVPTSKVVEVNISENDLDANISFSSCSNNVSEKTTDDLDRVDGKVSMLGGINKGMPNDGNRELEDHSSAETLKIPELVDPINMQRSADGGTCPESDAQSGKSKAQNYQRDVQCKVTEKEIGDDVHALVVKDTCLTPSNLEKHEIIGSCVVCYKKRRLAYDSPEEELCSCAPVEKDTGEAGSVQRSDHDIGLNETVSDIQIGSDENICVKCKHPGELLYCSGKGCRRCYHCFCLDPILYDASPCIWHCSYCTRKKIESGIYTVTKGVESIWDAREVMVLDSKETRRQKQYLVKYQGLAHVYNHWISESQLLLESPSLVTKYNAEDQRRVWNPDWTVPSRLLHKRPLVFNEPEDQCSSLRADNILDCQYEWLVKWCGLDYVHGTWELENSNFLKLPQGQKLIREYELRYEKAHRMVDKTTKGPFVKLKDRLSAGGSTLTDDCYLQNVNKLRELWYKNQNAVVFDEQERFANVIFFILSLSNDHQPFLIASTSEYLSQWEAEFLRLAPSIDVVVYMGDIDTRTSIRKLEFQEKHKGAILLQVLLAPIEVVIEDLKLLKSLKWKLIVIDGCQGASTDLEQMELLETDMRLLLFSGPIKDTVGVYSSLLSLLGSSDFPDKASDLKSDTADNLVKLKELLSRFTAYSKFVEYLVPVEISNLQLEQYCGELLANAPALRSNWKTDQVGAFREIITTLRKCCDHPYMVAPSLQSSMIKGLTQDQVLEVGIEASGKLQFLYEMLSKIRYLQHRALVLFQSISGSGEMAIGDILDDFVRGKFGSNSYERVDACLIPSKKQAALNRFSTMGGEHFVFLLENRACQSSIKLSVDIVIIFDSDWNPANDLKALQRLSIHSKGGQVNVFRLYSSCTIEEKVLILGKQNMNLESSLQMIKFSSTLLMWGASHLFGRLEEYHAGNRTDNVSDISHGQKLLCDVLSEFSAILSCSRKEDKSEPVISKVFRNAGTYTTNFPLLGEKKVQLIDVGEPHIFWKKLLEGKEPKWKFSLGQMPRSRKRVQYALETSKKSDRENDDTSRKRKKPFSTNISAAPAQLEQGEEQVEGSNKVASISNKLDSKNSSSSPNHQGSFANLNCTAHLQEKSPSDEQKSLHASVKEEMVKLCVVLKLKKEVQQMVDRFLEYVMENHHVNKEPASILQAFQMSLCWTASSILKQKIDKKESLELAKKILNFKCTEEEAISVYLKLRLLKKTFLQLPGVNSGSMSETIKSDSRNIRSPSSRNAGEFLSGTFNLHCVKANQELAQVQKPKNMLTGNDLKRRVKKIQKKCDKCISNLCLKHAMETQAFNKTWEEKKGILESDHRKELIFIRAIHVNGPMGVSKLKMAETEFAKKIADHEHLKEVELKKLEEKHSAAIEEKKKIFDNWLTDAISCSNLHKTVTEVHTGGSESEVEIVPNAHATNIIPNLPTASAIETFGCESPARVGPILLNSNTEKELETAIMEMASIPGVDGKDNCPSFQALEDIPSVDICSENHVTDEPPSTSLNNAMPSEGTCSTGCETGHVHTKGIGNPDVVQYADETPLTNQDHEMAIGVSTNDGQEMGPDHAIDAPVGLSLGNDKGDGTSDVARNLKDQHDVHITDSLSSDAVSVLNRESMDTQHEDIPVPGNQTTIVTVPLTPSGGGTNSVSNLEEFENNEQLEQASVDEDLANCLSPAAEDVCQGRVKESICLQNAVHSPQLLESMEVPCQTVSQNVENTVPRPPMGLLDSAQDQPDLVAANRVDHASNSEQPTHSHSEEAQVSQDVTELPNQAIPQPGPNSAMVEASHLQLYGAHRAASFNATLPLHADPLQNELEKIHKEIEQVIKLHDDTKLQLQSDCEKEIEEMAAQIRKKYEAKMKGTEEVFVLKKSELESNQNKVLMNKILAEAFKSKCMDLRPPRISGVPKVAPSSFMQPLHQFSLPSRQSPVISQHTTAVTGQHTANLSIQSTHRSPGNFSVVPTRPPLINAITPTIANARVGGEVRAPAPHLQPFRPPACTSSASMNLAYNPNQQVPVNVPVTSSSLAGLPTQKTLLMTSQFSQPNLPTLGLFPPVKIIQSSPSNQLSITDGGAQPHSGSSTPISALELLRNVHNQPSGQAPNVLPSSGSDGGGVDVASDVVCLSDDDD